MADNSNYSKAEVSRLVQLFAERAGYSAETAKAAMTSLIDGLRQNRTRRKNVDPLHFFLKERLIRSVEAVRELDADAFIEPLGAHFSDGFRMVLKHSGSERRLRFTMAHEICHTFFYELVPELKFPTCGRDEHEERLCNFGAATMLIPSTSLKRRAAALSMCLESLRDLAESFSVSLSTMALRLESTGLWHCQLSLWHRKLDGSFILDRLYGGRQVAWQWEDRSVLQSAWESRGSIFGRTFVSVQEQDRARRYRPISYQLQRYASGILALWGNGIRPGEKSGAPLFEGCPA
jgi:hypothetical protein